MRTEKMKHRSTAAAHVAEHFDNVKKNWPEPVILETIPRPQKPDEGEESGAGAQLPLLDYTKTPGDTF